MKNKIFFIVLLGTALALSACATGNLPRPMVIDNGPPTAAPVVKARVSQSVAATTPKPFRAEMLNEKKKSSPPAPTTQSAQPTQLAELKEQVEANIRLLGVHQKILLKHEKRIGWLEAYQRKMDERLAELTWNGADRRLTPIRIGNFGSGSAVLTKRLMAQTKASTKRLALIAQKAKNDGKTLTIKVLGYASQGGKSKNNMALSLKRAKAVADELRKGGINVTTVEGKGEISVGLYSRTNQCVRILPGIN